ncbi:MAG: hypothetical protein WCR97_04695 [Bacilli bacterium]
MNTNLTKTILAIDPSGNFTEGKGTTGWSILNTKNEIIEFGSVKAEDYSSKEEYWLSVLTVINLRKTDYVVMEDYLLYPSKKSCQSYSRLETPKLIGIIELVCYMNERKIHLQRAVDVKSRWNDQILVNIGIVQKTKTYYTINGVKVSDHIRDSIRHGLHFIKYRLEKEIICNKTKS